MAEPTKEELAQWLDEAADLIGDWGAYAGDYFQKKWDLDGDIQKFRERAAAARGVTTARPVPDSVEHYGLIDERSPQGQAQAAALGVATVPAAKPWDGGCEHCDRTDAQPRPDDDWCEHCQRGADGVPAVDRAQELSRLVSALRSAAFAEGISCEKALSNFGNDEAHAADRTKALAADEAHAALLAALSVKATEPPRMCLWPQCRCKRQSKCGMPSPSEIAAGVMASGEAQSRIPVEVWHGDRKVTVYPGETVLRVWGPNIDTEMSDEPFSLGAVQRAMDWLYAEGVPTVYRDNPLCGVHGPIPCEGARCICVKEDGHG